MVTLIQLRDNVAPRHYIKDISKSIVAGLLRISDTSSIVIVGLGTYSWYVYAGNGDPSGRYIASVLVGAFLAATLFQWFGAYSTNRLFRRGFLVDRVIYAWAVAFTMLLVIAFGLKITDFYSRIWTVSWFVGASILLLLGRAAIGQWAIQQTREGRFANRTVILGAGDLGQSLAAYLRKRDLLDTRVIGFIDDRRSLILAHSSGLSVLGDTGYLVELIRRNKVDQVLISLPWTAQKRLQELIGRLAVTPIRICLAPSLPELSLPWREFTEIADLPMIQVFDRPISGWSHILKRVEDICISFLMLLFVAPLMVIISAAIKFESPGSIFFKQQRYGFNDSLIDVWKFRTMYVDMSDRNCERQTTRDDPRMTNVGRFLRRCSLDELPQLFNVLSGNMSLVGPRPHAVATKAEGCPFAEVVNHYAARHRVKPGITGWAQVNGWRGETDTVEKIRKRVEHDLYYVDNWSIWLDLCILIRTLIVVFRGENAY